MLEPLSRLQAILRVRTRRKSFNPCLYDKRSRSYKSAFHRQAALQSLPTQMNYKGRDPRKKAKNMLCAIRKKINEVRIKLHPVVALQDSKFGGQRENSFELLPSSSPATTISKLKLFVFNEINNFYCSSSVSSMGESFKSAPTAVEKIGHPRSKRRSWNC